MSNRCCPLLAILILGVACLPLAAQTYSLQGFSVPYAPNYETRAWGINNRGAVVGHIFKPHSGGLVRGFKRDANGVFEPPIDDPDPLTSANFLAPAGINEYGVIVGYYASASHNAYSGFLLSKGVFTDYFLQPGRNTEIRGINNKGDFVGVYVDLNYVQWAFASVNGIVTTFNYPGADPASTIPQGIAADGAIVGYFRHNGQYWAFIRGPAGQSKAFQFPGALDTSAYGINDASHEIVGLYSTSSLGHGFVYDYISGAFTTVDWPPDPTIQATVVTGINSHGVIVGYVLTYDSQTGKQNTFGFIGTPQ